MMMNLADPELELIDPTPNVHSMFLHFDKTFFWAKLASRCVVRWSKRMYSCAGICSYEGRGGLCDIALSEPLLKLRPRKDLVETLLHEMIHAYLFVASKDRDRDGHGPIFQAHMHRINRAAGLNISIYHDFHDEVKLYQTHWWRCDGPCQFRKPHFGIVRRTNNRAPGPSDYWWDSHKKYCGGTFIKIKEPEKTEKKGRKTNVAKPNADITKYLNNNNNKEATNKNNNTQNNKPTKPILKDLSNVPVKPNVGIKSNRSSTIVVTKKNVIYNPQVQQKPAVFNGTPHKIGGVIDQTNNGDCKKTTTNNVLETVRNVWASKQIGTNNNKNIPRNNNIKPILSNPNKHKADSHAASPPPKVKKIDDYFKTGASSVLKDLYGQDFNVKLSKDDQKLIAIPKKLVDCPICNRKIDSNEINRHLDECLNKDVIEMLSKDSVPVVKHESSTDNYQNDKKKLNETIGHTPVTLFKKEPVPHLVKEENRKPSYAEKEINKQVNNVNTINLSSIDFFEDIIDSSNLKRTSEITDEKNLRKSDSLKVPTKLVKVQNSSLEKKIITLDAQVKMEPGGSQTDLAPDSACPCCGGTLNKTIDEHLDECLSFFGSNSTIPEEGASTSFTSETIVIDDDEDEFDESLTFNATGTKLPCPCCLKMIEEISMNDHLDKCLS